MKQIIKITLSILFIAASFISCVNDKDFDTPQVGNDCESSFIDKVTVPNSQVLQDFQFVADKAGSDNQKFSGSIEDKYVNQNSDVNFIVGYVISSDVKGNFYKELFIQDKLENPTAGIRLIIDSRSLYAKYRIGSKLLVKLNGLVAGYDRGKLTIGEETGRMRERVARKVIIRGCDIFDVIPTEITKSSDISNIPDGTLVKVMNGQFALEDLNKAYHDPNDRFDTGRDIIFCEDESTLSIETGGFASFADSKLEADKFNMIAVLTKNYSRRTIIKMSSREDIESLDTNRCDPVLPFYLEEFETLDNWTKFNATGSQTWSLDSHGNPGKCAKMTGYQGGSRFDNEDWLVSPAIDLSGRTAPILAFQSANNYGNSPQLEVYICGDYTVGEDPNSSGSWLQVNPTLSTGGWTWANSGDIDVSAYAGGDVFVAFKYTSTSTNAPTYEIDNVKVFEN